MRARISAAQILRIITDHENIFMNSGKPFYDPCLQRIRILIFIDKYIFKCLRKCFSKHRIF